MIQLRQVKNELHFNFFHVLKKENKKIVFILPAPCYVREYDN